jgi:hypothetical protein
MWSEFMAPQVPISLDERAAIEVALYAALSGRDTHINWAMFDSERWQRLGRLARTWQVAPLLHHAWRNQGPPNLPDALRDQLHQSYRRTAVEALVQQRELNERLLPAFAAAQIPVLLLKGAALAHTLYPAPGLRPMVDLDLLTGEPRSMRLPSSCCNWATPSGSSPGMEQSRAITGCLSGRSHNRW